MKFPLSSLTAIFANDESAVLSNAMVAANTGAWLPVLIFPEMDEEFCAATNETDAHNRTMSNRKE